MAHTLNMQRICDLLNARNIPADVEHTGGGVATIFAGTPYIDSEGEQRYPAVAGPGYYTDDGAEADPADFYIGADGPIDARPDFYTGPDDITETQVADRIAAWVQRHTDAAKFKLGDRVRQNYAERKTGTVIEVIPEPDHKPFVVRLDDGTTVYHHADQLDPEPTAGTWAGDRWHGTTAYSYSNDR